LEFLDEVKLEFGAKPRAELEGNVFVGVSAAAVAPSFRLKSDGTGCFDPFARGEGEAVEAGLIFKGLEFETLKSGLWICSQTPMNSRLLRFRIQL